MMFIKKLIAIFLFVIFLSIGLYRCRTPEALRTDSIPVVDNFDVDRYLGTWYEIARLPNKFEKNLDRVTATYTLRDDGKIKVLNKGYNLKEESWKEAEGKAWIPDSQVPAHLKVSFFWIFASDYKVIALDTENYVYTMVTSSSKKYLWILSRTPTMDEEVYTKLVEKARQFGFAVDSLYKVKHL
jgi:apolipoprotein D and lipocalin family protein